MIFEFTNNKRAFKMKFLTMRIKNNYDVEFDEKYHPEAKKDQQKEESKKVQEYSNDINSKLQNSLQKSTDGLYKKYKAIEEEQKRKEEILRQLHDEQYKDTKYI